MRTTPIPAIALLASGPGDAAPARPAFPWLPVASCGPRAGLRSIHLQDLEC